MSDIDTAVVGSLKALDPNGRLEKQTLLCSDSDRSMLRCKHTFLLRGLNK